MRKADQLIDKRLSEQGDGYDNVSFMGYIMANGPDGDANQFFLEDAGRLLKQARAIRTPFGDVEIDGWELEEEDPAQEINIYGTVIGGADYGPRFDPQKALEKAVDKTIRSLSRREKIDYEVDIGAISGV